MNFCKNDWNVGREANYNFPSQNYMLRLIISKAYYILTASLKRGKSPFFQYVMTMPFPQALSRIRRKIHAPKRPQTQGWFRTTRNKKFQGSSLESFDTGPVRKYYPKVRRRSFPPGSYLRRNGRTYRASPQRQVHCSGIFQPGKYLVGENQPAIHGGAV